MRLPDRLGALRERPFRLFFLGQSVSLFGDGFAPLALAFAVLELSGSAVELGFVLAARSVPLVLFLLIGGVFADRLPRRGVMVAADIVRAVTQGLLAALVVGGVAELWHFVALQALNGAASAFFLPAAEGLVPQTVRAERLQQANALRALAESAGDVAGPAVAGVLVATVGAGWALAVDSATFLLSAAFLVRLPLPAHAHLSQQPFVSDLLDGWREFASRTWLWVGVVYVSLANAFVLAPLWVLGPVVAKESLGGAPAWGLIASAFGLGSFLGGLAALQFRPRRPFRAVVLAMFALALPHAGLALEFPALAVAPLALAAGSALAFGNAVWTTTVQQHVPPAALARVSAYDWFGSLAVYPLGLALAGPLSALIGIGPALWLAGGWMIASSAAVLAVPSIRELRAKGVPTRDTRGEETVELTG